MRYLLIGLCVAVAPSGTALAANPVKTDLNYIKNTGEKLARYVKSIKSKPVAGVRDANTYAGYLSARARNINPRDKDASSSEKRLASQVKNYWPGQMADLKRALRWLKTIVSSRTRGVSSHPYLSKCVEADARLQQALKRLRSKRGDAKLKGLTDILQNVDDVAEGAKRAIRKYEKKRTTMRRSRDYAKKFRNRSSIYGARHLREIKRALDEAADNEFKLWEAALKTKRDACGQLTRANYKKKVNRVLNSMAGDVLASFKKRVDQLLRRSAKLYQYDCKQMQRIETAFCGVDFEFTPRAYRNNAPEVRLARDAASATKRRFDLVDRVHRTLTKYGQRLLRFRSTRSRAQGLVTVLKRERVKLNKLAIGAMMGDKHPVVMVQRKHGNDKHVQLAAQLKCTLTNVTIGSTKGIDCISGTTCTVYEFAPTKDKSDALKSAKKAATHVNRHVGSALRGWLMPKFSGQGSKAGGRLVCAMSRHGRCWDPKSRTTKFRSKVITYGCSRSKRYQCVR